jgi:diguanylate cyclase (GGDEF)-like protein
MNGSETGEVPSERIVSTLASLDYLFTWQVAHDGRTRALYDHGLLPGAPVDGAVGDPRAAVAAAVVEEDAAALERLLGVAPEAGAARGVVRVTVADGTVQAFLITVIARTTPGGRALDGLIQGLGPPDAQHDELTTLLAEMGEISALLEMQNLELEELRRQADERSRTDALTGAYNRRHLMETLAYEQGRASRSGNLGGVLLLDIDRFKLVNDTHGHPAGDAVLVAVASRLRGAVRKHDTVARFGGEEFAVLLPAVSDEAVLEERAESIRSAISAAPIILPGGGELTVTASCGAVLWHATVAAESVVELADQALYAAKRGGRDRVRMHGSLAADELAA